MRLIEFRSGDVRMNFSKMRLELNEFIPYMGLATGHTQTLLGHILPSEYIDFKCEVHILTLEDGDELFLEYFDAKSNYTISLYHGLAGDAQSDYIRRSAILAKKFGWNIILVNHRGVKNTKAVKTYHSGRGEDASAVIKWAKHKFAGSKHIALGFSMSGSVLLNLVTERYGDEQPDYAIVVHAPLDLAKSAELLTVGLSKLYDMRFYVLLKKIINERENGNLKLPFMARTSDIDEWYSSKVNGFVDAADYYEQCSALKYTDKILTKTFVLSAEDDPFIDAKDYFSAKWNSNVNLVMQKYGGHMGYYAKNKDPKYGRRWLDHYLESVFKKIQSF
jgi:uncharacterized protein